MFEKKYYSVILQKISLILRNSSNEMDCLSVFVDENLEKQVIWWLTLVFPPSFLQLILNLQQSELFFDEIKFSKISSKRLSFYKKVIDLLDFYKGWRFYYFSVNKVTANSYLDFVNNLSSILDKYSQMAVFIDYLTFPKKANIERKIINQVKPVKLCLRENSKASLFLQVSDLLVGIVSNLENNKIISVKKKELIDYIKSKPNILGKIKKL